MRKLSRMVVIVLPSSMTLKRAAEILNAYLLGKAVVDNPDSENGPYSMKSSLEGWQLDSSNNYRLYRMDGEVLISCRYNHQKKYLEEMAKLLTAELPRE